jgi:uncharacterized phage protein gp47/JayE
MPLNRPTLAELISRAASDIEAELPGTDARLRRSNLAAISRMHAAAVHGLYGYLAWAARQLMVDTAEEEHLVRWAALWGITRKAATYATGTVTVTGENGSVIPVDVYLQRADGLRYKVTTGGTVAGGQAQLTVWSGQAGLAYNAVTGTKLTFVEPVGGVNTTATVASPGISAGTDAEDDDALRLRVLERLQQPPMGGCKADYVAWAKQVPGVTRAWCFPLEGGPGKVVVRFVRDNDGGSIIPSAAEVAAVQAHIDPLRPVTATVTVAAPAALALNPNISVTPDTTAVREAIAAELGDFLQREASPGGRIYISRLREVVSSAAGEFDSVVVSPSADVVPSASQIVTLGTITWS